MIVKKGDKFLCIKTVVMHPTGNEAFIEGKVYISENDNSLTNEQGNKEHYVDNEEYLEDEDQFLNTYFRPYVEVFKLSEAGKKESNGKLSYELDFGFVTQMAERMDANKGKYEPYNWQKIQDIQGLEKALARHFFAVMRGEYEDDGRPLGHLEAIALNAMMINYQIKNNKK